MTTKATAAKMGTLVVVCLCLCISPISSTLLQQVLHNKHFQSDGLSFCNQTTIEQKGRIVVTNVELQAGFQCSWHISITNASSIRVFFLPLRPGQTLGALSSTMDVKSMPRINVYRSRPRETPGGPEFTWPFSAPSAVKSFDSSQLWIVFTLPRAGLGSVHTKTAFVSVSFVAHMMNEDKPQCRMSGPDPVYQGSFHFTGTSFGATAVLRCNEGFVIPDGSPRLSFCTADTEVQESDNGFLVWSKSNFVCESVCKHPPKVNHALVRTSSYTNVLGVHRNAISSPQNRRSIVRSRSFTARYSCELPYIISPTDHSGTLTCTTNELWSNSFSSSSSSSTSSATAAAAEAEPVRELASIPRWLPQSPACVIPDCSTTSTLKQRSGAVVNPSYPHHVLAGGRLRCRWQIIAPENAYIEVTTLYADLPQSDPSIRVQVFDKGHFRPRRLLLLWGNSTDKPQVRSDSTKVLITYDGPVDSTIGVQGFYFKYKMIPHSHRLRRVIRQSSNSSSVTDDNTQASPGDRDNNEPSNEKQQTTPLNDDPEQGTGDNSDSGSSVSEDGIIAVSVVVPLVALVAILVGGYFWYRRRYPVRMIIGRDVSKFTNPKYTQPKREATLVRNDAENFFSHPQDDTDARLTLEMNPVNSRWEQYDNPGYQGDEVDDPNHVADDEEEERKFREKKSWLFRRSEDKRISDRMLRKASKGGSLSSNHSDADKSSLIVVSKPEKGKEKFRKGSASEDSISSDISELMNEQKVTPKHSRRGVAKDPTTESSSTTESVVSSHSVTVHGEKHTTEEHAPSDVTESTEEDKSGSITHKEDQADLTEESNFMKTAKVIFEQPSFEQVMAEVKARSRSMSAGNIHLDLNARPRSYSVDPSKSARKTSLHDETILAAFSKSLAGRRILEVPISSASSHHSGDSEPELSLMSKPALSQQPSLSASIVGVDIKVRTASNTSIGSTGSSFSNRSVDGSTGAERPRLSLASTNSNPHLVTDLDDSSQEGADDAMVTENRMDSNVSTTDKDDVTAEVEKASDEQTFSTDISQPEKTEDVHNSEDDESSVKNNESTACSLSDQNSTPNDSQQLHSEPGSHAEKAADSTAQHGISGSGDKPEVEENVTDLSQSEPKHEDENTERLSLPCKVQDLDTDPNAAPLEVSPEEKHKSNIHDEEKPGNISPAIQLSTVHSLSSEVAEKLGDSDVVKCDTSTAETIIISKENSMVSDSKTFHKNEREEQLEREADTIKLEHHLGQTIDSCEDEHNSDSSNTTEHFTILPKNVAGVLNEDLTIDQRKLGKEEKSTDESPTTDKSEGESEEKSLDESHDSQSDNEENSPEESAMTDKSESETEEKAEDDSASDTSESDTSGVAASYDFGDVGSEGEAEEGNESEDDIEIIPDLGEAGLPSAETNTFDNQTETSPGDSDSKDVLTLNSSSSTSHDNLDGEGAAAAHDTNLDLVSGASHKRVKILPLSVNLSDDDEEDDSGGEEQRGEKYKLSDDEISDILNSSSSDSDSGEKIGHGSPADIKPKTSIPVSYTFQHYDDDDDDIDV